MNAPTRPMRVFVCDDEPDLRAALHAVLDSLAGFEFAGEAGAGGGLANRLAAESADLVVLDVRMPQGGPALAAELRGRFPSLGIVVFSAQDDPATEAAMRGAGADEFVTKTGRLGPLRDALRRCADHVATDTAT